MDDRRETPTFKKRVEVASGPHESFNITTKGVEVETAPKILGVKVTDRLHETNTSIQSKQRSGHIWETEEKPRLPGKA